MLVAMKMAYNRIVCKSISYMSIYIASYSNYSYNTGCITAVEYYYTSSKGGMYIGGIGVSRFQ